MDKNISETYHVSFEELKDTRVKIKQSFSDIDVIKKSIKQNYMDYIEQENENFFGLDSFHFQNKAIELEYENMLNLYHFIDNRIYGDYYKLFLMINESLQQQLSKSQLYKLKELQHLSKYPQYKDLEPFKIYDFDLIHQIHQDIVLILSNVKEMVSENEESIKNHQKHLKLGIQIDNYVINQNYINQRLKMSNDLHESYLQVFHNYHNTWLCKYYEKNKLFYKQICHHQENQQRYEVDEEDEEDKPVSVKEDEENKSVSVEEDKEEDEPVSVKEDKEEDEPVSVKEDKEEDEPVSDKEDKEEDEPVSVKEDKEEDEPVSVKEDKEEDEPVSVEDSLESIVIDCINDVIVKATQGAVIEQKN